MVALSNPDMKAFALYYYCHLVCPVGLLPHGVLLFSGEETEGGMDLGKGKLCVWPAMRRGSRGNGGWNVLYDKRIYLQFKKWE